MKPFLPALLLVALIVTTAPIMGQIRHVVFEVFPSAALVALFLTLTIPALGLLGVALLRLRDRHLTRFGYLGAAAVWLWVQIHLADGDGDVVVGLVERIHIVQYGLLAWLLYRALRRLGTEDVSLLVLPVVGATAAGALDEGAQFLVASRIGDIRDVGLDFMAAFLGPLLGLGFDPPGRMSWQVVRPFRLSVGVALSLLVVGVFFSVAHLGYRIEDPEIGAFRSWHSRAELLAAAEDRQARWAQENPKMTGWALEDRFLTEAGWLSAHRDHNFNIGQLDWARSANRILEKYYGPYLDLENFQRGPARRYGPKIQEKLETSPARDPGEYFSPVLRKRIFVWPSKVMFWSFLLPLVTLVAAAPWLWPRWSRSFGGFLPPTVLSLVIVLAAPFVGLLRDFLFDTFPGQAVRVLGAVLFLLAVAFLGFGVLRIRENRLFRYGGLVVVALLLWVQSVGFRTDLPQVNVAEKIHIVEYGLLAWWLYRAFHQRWRGRDGVDPDLGLLLFPLLGVALVGTLDEAMQWWVETRTGEVRDVGLNLFSGCVGLLFAVCLDPPRRLSVRSTRWVPITDGVALVVLVLGTFIYQAHLGYLIEDPNIGRFRSWFSPEELREAAADRAVRWAEDPPGDASPWNREDFFLTEAGWHNLHRNSSFQHELYALARHANRILETYYQPYLDLEHFRRTGKRRYAPHTLKKLAQEAPVLDTESYVSPVLAKRIYIWPSKPAFLGGLLASLVFLLGFPRWWARRALASGESP